jgi:hypothetical protein
MDSRADCGLSEKSAQGEGDTGMMGLEDITAEAREVEFGWLRSSNPQLQDIAHSSFQTKFLLLSTSRDVQPRRDLCNTERGCSATHGGRADNSRPS